MKTNLDDHHELELQGHYYDGDRLIAEVWELVVGKGGRVEHGSACYNVFFLGQLRML